MRTCQFPEILRAWVRERQRLHPRYSLRAIARRLTISEGALSEMLAGKRVPGPRVLKRMLAGMELTDVEARELWRAAAENRVRAGLRRVSPAYRQVAEANRSMP